VDRPQVAGEEEAEEATMMWQAPAKEVVSHLNWGIISCSRCTVIFYTSTPCTRITLTLKVSSPSLPCEPLHLD
jgi:hypothetical protein